MKEYIRRNPETNFLEMYRVGHPGLLLSDVLRFAPNAAIAMRNNRLIEGKVDFYQVAILYAVARQYNVVGNIIVDFGTMYGWSASMLGAGAPNATVHTLEPDRNRRLQAKNNLAKHKCYNVEVHSETSVEFQREVANRGVGVDMVFVDGNHHECEPDMGWWELIKPGGAMLFHDYTPKYQSVVTCVNRLVHQLGKEVPDILVVNRKNRQGMAGVYKT